METIVVFASLFILVFIGVPVGYAIGGATMLALYFCTNLDMVISAQYCFSGINSFTILSIPFFMLAGALMSTGGLARRIVQFAQSLVGAVTGSLCVIAVLASMIFGAVSGSGMATTAAIGGMMIPEMRKQNYNIPYSTTLICFAGTIDVLIPPSLSFIIYGAVTSTSVAALFLAGVIPGILMGAFYIAMNYYMCKKHKIGIVEKKEITASLKEHMRTRLKGIAVATKEGVWALLAPVIILGGIYSGLFTPTESACVAVVYSAIISIFVYREMNLKSLYQAFVATAILNGATCFLLGYSTVFSTFLSFAQIPAQLFDMITTLTSSKVAFLLIVNLVLLVLGCFLDTVPAITVMAPLLLPAALSFGIDPVHFGIIMTMNLAIGLCTPPYGCNLFVGTAVARIKMESMLRYIIPYLIAAILCLLVVTFVPAISLILVK